MLMFSTLTHPTHKKKSYAEILMPNVMGLEVGAPERRLDHESKALTDRIRHCKKAP